MSKFWKSLLNYYNFIKICRQFNKIRRQNNKFRHQNKKKLTFIKFCHQKSKIGHKLKIRHPKIIIIPI